MTLIQRGGNALEYGFHVGLGVFFVERMYRATRRFKGLDGKIKYTSGWYGKPMKFYSSHSDMMAEVDRFAATA